MPTYLVKDSQTGLELKLTGDSPPTEQELEAIFSEYAARPDVAQGQPQTEEGPSLGQVGAGVATEVGVGVGSQALGATLAPFTFGISYPVLAFSGGVAGSIAAQKIEGREKISPGRALFAGLVNLIPGGGVAKGAKAVPTLAKAAGRGALTGAGEAVVTKVVDEGRLPTPEEALAYAGPGAIAGGAFKGIHLGGGKLWNKIANKTPDEVDAMIARGEIQPSELTPTTNIPEVNASLNAAKNAAEEIVTDSAERPIKEAVSDTAVGFLGRLQRAGQSIQAAVAPSTLLGKEIQSEAILSKNQVLAATELGSKIAKDVDAAIKKQANPVEAANAVNEFLNGRIAELPVGLRSIQSTLELGREKVKELQGKLVKNIDTGATEASDELRDTITRSMDEGNYLTREFRFFADKDYLPTTKQRQAALAELGEGGEEYLASLDKKKLSNVGNRNYLPAAVDGFLRQRQEIGPALLDYLGEITEPGERIRGTLSRVARGVYRDEADANIKNLLVARGLASNTPTQGMGELFLKRYEKEGSGLYVMPNVQDALNQVYLGGAKREMENPIIGGLKDLWNAGVGLSKAVKVLVNPPSYAVQVYGNAVNLIGMGINPFAGAGRGLRLALSEYGPISNLTRNPEAKKRLIADAAEMTKYGIKGSNILDSDIRSGFERGIFSKLSQKGLDPLAKAYTVPDTVGRFVAWKANQKVARNMFPSADSETIKRFAADVTNDTYQNYDRLSKTFKELSKVGIVPQFASFTAEFARNQYNQGRIIGEMMQGTFGRGVKGLGQADLAAMRTEGGRRLSSLMAVYGISFAAIKAWNANHNVTDAKEAALKETVLPDWDENKMLAITLSDDGKTGKYANPSYIVPHYTGLAALDEGLSGRPIEGVRNLLINEFVGEGSFLARSVISGVSNVNLQTGKPLSYETDKFKNAQERFAFAMDDAFRPGIAREVTKLQQSLRGQGQISPQDVLRRQAGVRLNAFNTQEAAMFKIKQSVNNSRLASADYSAARDYRNLSPEQLMAVYQKSNSAYRDSMVKITRHANNLATLGFSQDEIIKTIKESGLGSSNILNVLNNQVPDLPLVKRETGTQIWEDRISQLPRAQQMSEIRKITREKPPLGRSLISIYKSEELAKRRGMTPIDSLIMSLGTSDGSRAEYIYKQSLKSQNPDAYIQAMARKGIVTGDVMRQIRMMQQANQ
jgi:hypothetical protein